MFTAPLSPAALEAQARQAAQPLVRRVWVIVPVVLALALGVTGFVMWSRRAPLLAPRHRAEALCFVLAQPPAFAPPMSVEPSAALVRGRFALSTPALIAAQEVMHFTDLMIVRQSKTHVGDYDVSTMWLRLPEPGGVRLWLIVAWMEGGDLALCSFRFAGDRPELTPEQLAWGNRLLRRALQPENFDAARMPDVHLRVARGATIPTFGPPPGS